MTGLMHFPPRPQASDPHQGGRCVSWRTALLCIDLQYLNCHYGLREAGNNETRVQGGDAWYRERLDTQVLPNVRKLQDHFRRYGGELIHVRIQSLTADGRDRSVEHKELGLHAPPGSRDAQFLPEVAPLDDEIVINKTASGVFVSTNLEYILRNLCVSDLVIVGVFTNECISSAVRSSSDLGFQVRLVSDATAAMTRELHEATLLTTHGRYAQVMTTAEAIQDVGTRMALA